MQGSNQSNVNVTRGIPQSADAKRTRTTNVLQGIRPLDLSQPTVNGEATRNRATINRIGDKKKDEERKSWA